MLELPSRNLPNGVRSTARSRLLSLAGRGLLLTSCGYGSAACGTSPAPAPQVDAATEVGDGGADAIGDSPGHEAAVATMVSMDFGRSSFYAAPFPSEDRRTSTGSVDLTGFPNPTANPFVQSIIAMVDHRLDGFGTTSAVYFQLTAAPAPARLPIEPRRTVEAGSPVFLMSVDPTALDRRQRYPVAVTYQDDAGPYGAPRLLAVSPLQGIPLRPRTLYAAVVLRALGDVAGQSLGVSPELTQLLAGQRPPTLSEGAFASYRGAIDELQAAGVPQASLAGLAVFRTADPTAEFQAFRDAAVARSTPKPEAPLTRTVTFDDYCVYEGTIPMPVYQRGAPPYASTGGDWVRDAQGAPAFQRDEQAKIVVTVPRRTMPTAGFPLAVLIRTGAGGERPLVDRGPRATAGGPAIAEGSGPASLFARAGMAGASADGPHGGLRNVSRGDEQFLMFNVQNPVALKDNVRQNALETVVLVHALSQLAIDASDCAGVTTGGEKVRFDTKVTVLMGHSMGATIAPLALSAEPLFGAAVLSGAGGSWISNVMHKRKPLPVRPLTEVLVGYAPEQRSLREDDPVLNLFQWAAESADPPVYAPYVLREPKAGAPPRHVLMMQGIVDNYILPPIANATSLSLGLDLAGPPLDEPTMGLTFTPLASLLPLVQRTTLPLPIEGNRASSTGRPTTAVVTQIREDGIEDGHEVVFQTDVGRRATRCFLEGLAAGRVPRVPAPGSTASEPCP